MLFNSYEFLFLYLPIVFAGFFLIARLNQRAAALWLAAASIFFYGWWNPHFVSLLLGSILFNYALGYAISVSRDTLFSKPLFVAAITANLALLGYYKYANFFLTTINQASGATLTLPDIILPLGISFFTFTQIAFLVDVYRGIAREYNLIHYLLFVTYFPHLIAGPVLHHKEMMPQFESKKNYRLNSENVAVGLSIFTIGLAKKILLADSFSEYANPVFDAARDGISLSPEIAWIGALAYTLQLYFDFSGYSDMAIGLSMLFGIQLPLNFNSPYKAHNIIEFWRRWHMTLSRFLRDYLYIPLGGGRKGVYRRYINLMVTMLLGGLWHGANWTFVAWGGVHGLFLAVNHGWHGWLNRMGYDEKPSTMIGRAMGITITFTAVVAAWVLFRAETFDAAMRILGSMAGLPNPLSGAALGPDWNPRKILAIAGAIGIGLLIVLFAPNTQQIMSADSSAAYGKLKRLRFAPATAVVMGILFGASIAMFGRVSQFIYFQF